MKPPSLVRNRSGTSQKLTPQQRDELAILCDPAFDHWGSHGRRLHLTTFYLWWKGITPPGQIEELPLEDALRRYARNDDETTRKRIAAAALVFPKNVPVWISGDAKPLGPHRIRLRYFLLEHGFVCTGFKGMRPEQFFLGLLFARGTLTLEHAQAELGVSRRCLMTDWMQQPVKMQPTSVAKVRALLSRYGIQLPDEEPAPQPQVPATAEAPTDAGQLLADLLVPMERLASYLVQGTTNDRDALRSRAGHLLFRTSNLLDALCSERARETLLKERREHGGTE